MIPIYKASTNIIVIANIAIVVTIFTASPTRKKASVLRLEPAPVAPKENFTKMTLGTIKAKPPRITE